MKKHVGHFRNSLALVVLGIFHGDADISSGTVADDSPFFDNDMPTMRSSSSSSEGLPHVVGLNWEGSVESNEVNTGAQKSHCYGGKQQIFLICSVRQVYLYPPGL